MSLIEIVEPERDEEANAAYCATLCSCSCADVCPLGKKGIAGRCTADELRRGFLKYKITVRDLAGRLENL